MWRDESPSREEEHHCYPSCRAHNITPHEGYKLNKAFWFVNWVSAGLVP